MSGMEPSFTRGSGRKDVVRDEVEFVQFAAKHRDRLRALAYLHCGEWAAADLLVVEGLIRTYVDWHRLADSGAEYAGARRCLVAAATERGHPWSAGRTVPGEPMAAPGGLELDLLALVHAGRERAREHPVLGTWSRLRRLAPVRVG